MILPTKHLTIDRCELGIGADILHLLDEPKTVSRLWDEFTRNRANVEGASPVTYDWFILALDMLYAMNGVQLERGRIKRASDDSTYL